MVLNGVYCATFVIIQVPLYLQRCLPKYDVDVGRRRTRPTRSWLSSTTVHLRASPWYPHVSSLGPLLPSRRLVGTLLSLDLALLVRVPRHYAGVYMYIML